MNAHDAALQSLATQGKAAGAKLDAQLNAIFAKRTYTELSDETRAMLVAYKNAAKAGATPTATGDDDEDSDKEQDSDSEPAKGSKRKGKPKSTDDSTKTTKPAQKKKSPQTPAAKKKATPKKATPKKSGTKPAKGKASKLAANLRSSTKVFRLPCTVRSQSSNEKAGKETLLDLDAVQADQGSDFNLITDKLAIKLGLAIKPLSQSGFKDNALTMRTSEGREKILKHFVTFELGVSNVWRMVQCFVLCKDTAKQHSSDEVQLLLGMPWLYDANAVINIRDSSVDIGDPSRGEVVKCIQGPQQRFSEEHNLIMYGRDGYSDPEPIYRQSFSTQVVPNGDVDSDDDDDNEPSLQDVWHNFNISQFQMGELPNWAYFQDYEPPDVDPEFSAVDFPGEQAYVDLAKFVELLKWDNGLPPVDGRPQLDNAYFNMLENWLPAPGQYEDGADALLGVLLTALLDSDDAAQIFCTYRIKFS